jgi:YD repeat-containing protein
MARILRGQYDSANQLQTSQDATGTTTYHFDSARNLQVTLTPANRRTTNVSEGENRRLAVQLPSGVVDTSVYNEGGLRGQVLDSNCTRNIVWDGQAYLLETGATGVTSVVYTQEPTQFGNLISQCRNVEVPP